jgi:hypothetical protein
MAEYAVKLYLDELKIIYRSCLDRQLLDGFDNNDYEHPDFEVLLNDQHDYRHLEVKTN